MALACPLRARVTKVLASARVIQLIQKRPPEGDSRPRNRSLVVDPFLLTLSVSGGTIAPSLPRGGGATLAPSMRPPKPMRNLFQKLVKLLADEQGQDIAEYAVMLAVILVLVVGTIRLVGSNANNAFSSVASSLQ